MLVSSLVSETDIPKGDVSLNSFLYQLGFLSTLDLQLIFIVKNLKDVSCSYLGLVHVRDKVRVVADSDASEEDLIDCSEHLEQGNVIFLHEDSAYVEQDAKDDEGDDLGEAEEEARNGAISCKHALRLVNIPFVFVHHCIFDSERNNSANTSKRFHHNLICVLVCCVFFLAQAVSKSCSDGACKHNQRHEANGDKCNPPLVDQSNDEASYESRA